MSRETFHNILNAGGTVGVIVGGGTEVRMHCLMQLRHLMLQLLASTVGAGCCPSPHRSLPLRPQCCTSAVPRQPGGRHTRPPTLAAPARALPALPPPPFPLSLSPVQALRCTPGKNSIILRRRKGFIKLALRTGALLAPSWAFGVSAARGSGVGERPVMVWPPWSWHAAMRLSRKVALMCSPQQLGRRLAACPASSEA